MQQSRTSKMNPWAVLLAASNTGVSFHLVRPVAWCETLLEVT